MNPVNNISQIMETLRKQMADNIEKMRRHGKLNPNQLNQTQTEEDTRITPQALKQRIAQRLKGLDKKDPRFKDKAATIFIESILVSEFGQTLMSEPEFHNMVNEVGSIMGADPAIANEMSLLITQLQSS